MVETWKIIPNYERYTVSNLGRVKSPRGLLTPNNNNNYLRVSLFNQDGRKRFNVHVLVAICFLNHEPNGHDIEVDHIDGDKHNNVVGNLQLLTARKHRIKDIPRGFSKYPGVSWHKNRNYWCAKIVIAGKQIHLGKFDTELDAAKAYNDSLINVR